MPDEPVVTPVTPPPAPAPTPPANDPTARNPDGSIKDLQATPTTDTKTSPATESKVEPKVEPPKDAPTYADFKAPDGFEIDKAALDKFTPLFKEMGLSQDQAQKLVDQYIETNQETAAAPYKAYEDMRAEWRKTAINDPALGDGRSDLKPEVKAVIGRAVDSLPPDVAKEFREAMILTGAGDHPAFVKAFYNLAERLGEGTLVRGGGPSALGQTDPKRPISAAAALFPNLPSSSR